ncbi:MAG: hypothetical protein ACREQZ_10310 [Woeseiaceae bacterium]
MELILIVVAVFLSFSNGANDNFKGFATVWGSDTLNGRLPDIRLQALAHFARRLVAERGWLPDSAVEEFLAAGFNRAQAFDVLVGVSLKTLSNYANHLLKTPVNPQLASETWQRSAAA